MATPGCIIEKFSARSNAVHDVDFDLKSKTSNYDIACKKRNISKYGDTLLATPSRIEEALEKSMPALAQGVDEDGLLEEFLDMIDIGCWDNDASIADEHDVMNDDDVIMSDDEHDNHDLDSTKRVGKECDNTCANIHSSLPSVNNPPSEAPSA